MTNVSVLNRLDRQLGVALRALANLLTGNSFRRLESRIADLEIQLAEIQENTRALSGIMKQAYNEGQEEAIRRFVRELDERP